ncbi:transmembrane protein-like protein 66 [Hyaloscypha sp. PMI_1271]|nr:transmembrane protein-like protein 66 [Hyaloscypha sp. PMI_1271]
MRLPFLYPALLALLFSSVTEGAKKPPAKDAILLSQVKTLTLRNNAKTSHRRVSAVPQLTCKGPGCAHYKVDIMRCTNQGSAYSSEDVEWSCTASLPPEFKLGSTDVVCEGYRNRDDEYILKGSCGVEYRLVLTDLGEEKYGGGGFWGSKPKSGGDEEGWTWSSVLFVFVFLGVLGWIIYSAFQATPGARRIPRQRPGGFWGGGWGGGGPGGGDPYDPPPPYPGTYPGKRYGYGATDGWRPGFWSGALGGAAAGYMAGNRGNRQEPAPQRGNSWFGGDSGGFNNAPRRSGSSSSSSARHDSTGFGSTSRR